MVAQIDKRYIRTRSWKLWSRMVSYLLFEGRPLTTRGQWINSFLFFHFGVEKRLPRFRKVKQPVFILGTGRSGTTILGIVLSMHKDVGFLNEPKALWHSLHPHEDLIGSYSRGPARYRLGAEDASPELIDHAHKLFGAYLGATFSCRVVDKYPELIFRIPFVKAIFPDAKFLFLARNGWDTCHSIEAWSNRLGQQASGEVHDWWGANRRKWNLLLDQIVLEHPDLAPHSEAMRTWTSHTDMAALEWIVTMREGMSLMQQFPGDVLAVRYESLCIEPDSVMREITRFLDLASNDDRFMEYGVATLTPVRTKSPFPLHEAIQAPFMDVMDKLNY